MTTRMRIGMTVQATSISRVVRGARGNGVRLGVELHHHIDQQRQHEERDHGDDRQQQAIVEPVNSFHGRRRRLLQAHLPRLGIAFDGLGFGHARKGPPKSPRTAVNVLRNFIVTLSSQSPGGEAPGRLAAAVPVARHSGGDCEPHSEACRNVGRRGKTSLRSRPWAQPEFRPNCRRNPRAAARRATRQDRTKTGLSWPTASAKPAPFRTRR